MIKIRQPALAQELAHPPQAPLLTWRAGQLTTAIHV